MIQWLMDSAQGNEKKTENLVSRILMVNFAAVHTTAIVSLRLVPSLTTIDVYAHFVRSCGPSGMHCAASGRN